MVIGLKNRMIGLFGGENSLTISLTVWIAIRVWRRDTGRRLYRA